MNSSRQGSSPGGSQSPPIISLNYISTYTPPPATEPSLSADEDRDSSSPTSGGPVRSMSRAQTKGGCWTCRVRRKKCDEQRQGDSCQTCKRLTLQCLGWGPKRPDWMRDKRAVDDYKASIKARLTSQGLIRGQPRSHPLHAQARTLSQNFSPTQTNSLQFEHDFGDPNVRRGETHSAPPSMPGLPGSSNGSFDQQPSPTFIDENTNSLFSAPFNAFSSPSLTSSSSYSTVSTPSLYSSEVEAEHFAIFSGSTSDNFGYDGLPVTSDSPTHYDTPRQTAFQEELVMRYFEHNDVRKVQFGFAADAFKDITYQAVLSEPQGAVTNCICALVDLYTTRMRIARGLEPPDTNLDQALYLRIEAFNQLQTSVKVHGWRDNDAIAALHLITFSQLSSGLVPWEEPFLMLCDWLDHSGLPSSEDPWVCFNLLSLPGQTIVKAILWLDVFSSLSQVRPPKFFMLWKSMLGQVGGHWREDKLTSLGFGMDRITGCPDDVMLAFAEISSLAGWKRYQERKGTLSARELVHLGEDIERRLRERQQMYAAGRGEDKRGSVGTGNDVNEGVRNLIGEIFRESAILYLNTILSSSSPHIAEIQASTNRTIQLLARLQPSDADRGLVFPIGLAGSLANNPSLREVMKGRFRYLDENVGNLMQVRLIMESIWQKRDSGGGETSLQNMIREHGLDLLLT